MLQSKKNSYKEFDNEKKFLRLENSPPPHNFYNGPSLNISWLVTCACSGGPRPLNFDRAHRMVY